MSEAWNDCELHGTFIGSVCPECTKEHIYQLTAERDQLRDRVHELFDKGCDQALACIRLEAQLTTVTKDFDTTWEALMELEKRFTKAEKALRAARDLINAHHNINEGSALDWGEHCKPYSGGKRLRYEDALATLGIEKDFNVVVDEDMPEGQIKIISGDSEATLVNVGEKEDD